MLEFNVTKNQELGLYEGTLTVELPKITFPQIGRAHV